LAFIVDGWLVCRLTADRLAAIIIGLDQIRLPLTPKPLLLPGQDVKTAMNQVAQAFTGILQGAGRWGRKLSQWKNPV